MQKSCFTSGHAYNLNVQGKMGLDVRTDFSGVGVVIPLSWRL